MKDNCYHHVELAAIAALRNHPLLRVQIVEHKSVSSPHTTAHVRAIVPMPNQALLKVVRRVVQEATGRSQFCGMLIAKDPDCPIDLSVRLLRGRVTLEMSDIDMCLPLLDKRDICSLLDNESDPKDPFVDRLLDELANRAQ